MDYFLEFHFWYLIAALPLFMFFGKGKGGIVVKRLSAEMKILDPRFDQCRPDASYAMFKEGSPDHIDIEVKNLFLAVDETLEFQLNGKMLAVAKVKRNKKAKFDHWSDEGVNFPKIKVGDELVIRYQDVDVLKGRFQ